MKIDSGVGTQVLFRGGYAGNVISCVRNCPADAIDIDNKTFNLEACIGCYGCINRCPKHAISSANSEVEEFMKGFIETFKRTRLEPDIFL